MPQCSFGKSDIELLPEGTSVPDVSFFSCSKSDSCRCLTVSLTVLTCASILIRRLLVVCFLVLAVGGLALFFVFVCCFLDISGTSSYDFGTTCTGS